jgi:uncharacterized protein involved in outer membrane biogenesis
MTQTPSSPDRSPAADQPATAPRKTGRKVLKWIVLIVLLVVVGGGIFLYLNLNEIIRSTVEKQSSNSLNVPTKLQGANLSLFGGEVGLKNFEVGSPQGFKSPNMMTLGGIDVGVKLGDLRNDPLRVNKIIINDPKLVIEMQGMSFNIKKFIDSLPAGESDPKPADGSEPMKLIINDLKVQGAQVILRPDVAAMSSLPGVGDSLKGLKQEYVLSIPALEMKDIGSGEGNQNGAAIKEIVTMLVTQLAQKATESDQLPPELKQLLNLNVKDLTEMAKAKLGQELNKQLDKIGQDVSKKLPGETGKALEGVLKDPAAATKDPGKAAKDAIGGILSGGQKKPSTTTKP